MNPVSIGQAQQDLLDDLSLFQDWNERYEYIIGLGRKLPAMDATDKTPEHLIKGCQSQVWFRADLHDGKVIYAADSDSLITKGMIALFVRVLSGHTPEEIVQADMGFLEKTGLKEHLAPTRANGLVEMSRQMKQAALAYLS